MIAHYTYGWTQRCVNSFFAHIPDKEIIVFNNNPFPNQIVGRTRGTRGINSDWNELCKKETEFVYQHPNITVVEVPRKENTKIDQLPTHGDVLDFSFKWCHENEYETLVHIEPDCRIHGKKWLEQMTLGLKDRWFAFLGESHLCPTLWSIKDILNLETSFEKTEGLNTARKIIKECQKYKKVVNIPHTKDIVHFGKGTRKDPFEIAFL